MERGRAGTECSENGGGGDSENVGELPTEGVDYGLVWLVGRLVDWLARSAAIGEE